MEFDFTEAGRNKLQGHYPQGIPHRIIHTVDGEPTIEKVA